MGFESAFANSVARHDLPATLINAKLNKSLAAGCTHTLHDGHCSFLAITNLGPMLLRFAVKSLAEEWLRTEFLSPYALDLVGGGVLA